MLRIIAGFIAATAVFAASGCSGCASDTAEAENNGTTVVDDGRTRTTTTDHGRNGTVVEQRDSNPEP